MINERGVFIGCTYRHNGNWCGKRTDDLDTSDFDFNWTPSDWYLIGECLMFLDDISGIPLTPEILESCGFEKHAASTYAHINQNLSYVFKISHIGDGKWYSINTTANIPTKYLHQLQNLYFALTNEELIYSPK